MEYIWHLITMYEMSGLTPMSYTIDFGITKDNETELIEVNDGWSVGSYGLDSKLYAKFLRDRWFEIMNKN